VTGGAGFVGSHIVDALAKTKKVSILDNLSRDGSPVLVPPPHDEGIEFHIGSILNAKDVERALDGVSTVYHFAGQPDVRLSAEKPYFDFEMNVVGGMTLLEAMRRKDVGRILFASSGGTVYGEPETHPTHEETPLKPISNYGAAKAALEMYLSSYSRLYGMSAVSMRLGNVIGPRLQRGVIYDFYMKLKRNPTHLEVLGDGTEEKVFIYIDDVVSAVNVLERKMRPEHLIVNVSSGQRLRVSTVAEIVRSEMKLPNAKISYLGLSSRGKGDVPCVDLDNSRLKSLGWKPSVTIEEGAKKYIAWLQEAYP
jgi:UDP-glucose 4-epimerase